MNELSSDHAVEEFVIPSGGMACEINGSLPFASPDEVQGHMLDGVEVGGRVVGSHPALVIAERHVHDPMQAVLDCPVAAHDRPDFGCRPIKRGDVEAGFLCFDPGDFPHAVDDDDTLQPGPLMPMLEPGDIVDHGRRSGFDAAMTGIAGFVAADGGLVELTRFLFGDEEFDVLLQATLVALQRQDVIGLFIDDLLRDHALAADGVNRNDGPLDRQHIQQLGDGDDLVRLLGHLNLTEHKVLARRKGRDHVDSRCSVGPVMRAAHRFAVDSDHALRHTGDGRDPGNKATLELFGIEGSQDIAEMVVSRRTIFERREPAQQLKPLHAEQSDSGDTFRSSHHRGEAQQQDLAQRIGHLAALARIAQAGEMPQKNNDFLKR